MSYPSMLDKLAHRSTAFALRRAGLISLSLLLSTLLLVALAALPSLWPQQFPGLHALSIDTDPENMLAADEPVRQFHDQATADFAIHDLLVIGIINRSDPDGVFNPASLARIHALSEYAAGLSYPATADGSGARQTERVIGVDILSPGNVDDIRQDGPGQVAFSWLMPEPPDTREQARAVRDRALRIPMLAGTMLGRDHSTLALYLPLSSKSISWNVRRDLLAFVADWPADDELHITGLPVAEDTFGVEMFYQMAISAPLAMLVIFLLMWWFFGHLLLVISPMIVALVSALSTMALLIISGNTIHIMSSMIPIFIMPIAVLDAVHILSAAFDSHHQHETRADTMQAVMTELFRPMLFTTLTTSAGFASLALTPIPPVQVFGIFVAIGVLLAWLFSITFIPAYFMLIPEQRLQSFGHATSADNDRGSWLVRSMQLCARLATTQHRLIMLAALLMLLLSVWGISRIQINDNPIKWFESSHPIRVADQVLNDQLAGTYMAYLQIEANASDDLPALRQQLIDALKQQAQDLPASDAAVMQAAMRVIRSEPADELNDWYQAIQQQLSDQADHSDQPLLWEDAWQLVDRSRALQESFKQPAMLAWLLQLQQALQASEQVGKINALTDIVQTVYRELLGGDDSAYRLPESSAAVAQTLLTYQNSHRPQDLWHFVTPDFRRSNLWVQLNSGDNRDMEQVIASLERFLQSHPPPQPVSAKWFGLTYINVVWQDKMVHGMLLAFLGSFLIVLLMMSLLFRSLLWGLLAMLPLTLTVALIYAVIGFIGKDYDMPVAVLSALSLGLAVDFAIHLLTRTRQFYRQHGSWAKTVPQIFGEPARAISRNIIVLGAGFLPLLAAPLVPYQTVGIFIAAIIFAAGMITLLLLPAVIEALQRPLFDRLSRRQEDST